MQNALRELEEETGLVGRSCRLAAVVTERDSHSGEQWLMFVFHCDGVTGELSRGSHEGKPSWVAIADLPLLPCPPADQHIAEAVFSGDGGVAFVNVRFDEGRLTDVTTTRDI
jgi:ADP-ribose pyrophosphatase YjhB (NUDIX family)